MGDVLIELDGKPVTGPDSLRDVLSDLADKTVKVSLIRAGQKLELDVLVGTRS